MRRSICALLFFAIFCGIAVGEMISLPTPRTQGKMSLEESISRRRSERSFLPNVLTREQISQLLWACQGITDTQWNFRAAPSSGSIYPLEIYVVDNAGVHHYKPEDNRLVTITKGNKRPQLSRAALAQNFVEEAPVSFVITAVYSRTRFKYGLRAERYVQMEAGHAAENLLLQATAMGLGSVSVGSFWDDVVSSCLALPPEHEPIYIIPVGYIKQ